MKKVNWIIWATVFTLLGCDGDPKFSPQGKIAAKAPGRQDGSPQRDSDALAMQAPVPGREEKAEGAADKSSQPASRKIIYTASYDLVVDDLDQTEKEINRLVKDNHGYIAKADLRGSTGSPRSGTWTIRVPIDSFDVFRDAAGRLGELTRGSVDSDDITDKYYDLQAHLKNDQTEEEGLRTLLKEKSANGKLEDILSVRRELKSIRGEIDRQQGQIQRWDKETAYATFTLVVHDRKDYVPPKALSFNANINQSFFGSVDNLRRFGQGVVLLAVVLTPWLPLMVPFAGVFWWVLRRTRQVKAPQT